MKSKKLGRSELLNWVNKTVESDYIKIEDLSDGVGFCQIIDAFFKNVSKDMNNLKLNAINEIQLIIQTKKFMPFKFFIGQSRLYQAYRS